MTATTAPRTNAEADRELHYEDRGPARATITVTTPDGRTVTTVITAEQMLSELTWGAHAAVEEAINAYAARPASATKLRKLAAADAARAARRAARQGR